MSQDKNKLVKRYKSITFMITYLKVYFTIGFRIRHKRRKYGSFFFFSYKQMWYNFVSTVLDMRKEKV